MTSDQSNIQIRLVEADDCFDVYDMFTSPKVSSGTLQLPYPSREYWRKRISDTESGTYNLVAVVDSRVVGMLSVSTFPNRPRRRHAGRLGISVKDEWHGKGIGSALMRAGIEFG